MKANDFDRLFEKAGIPSLLADPKLQVIRLNAAYRSTLGSATLDTALPLPIANLLAGRGVAAGDVKRILASMTRVAKGSAAEAVSPVSVPASDAQTSATVRAWTFAHAPFVSGDQRFVLQRILDVTGPLEEEVENGSGAQHESAPSDLALRILLVEDDADSRMAVSDALQSLGHRVTTTNTAEEALRVARKQRFDVLFSDIGLPDGNGATLVRQLLREQPSLKVILSSGYAMPTVDLGEDVGQLSKPYDLDRLEEVLAKLTRS